MTQVLIQKWGNSQGVRLPKVILNAANLRENDTVAVFVDKNSIMLRKVEPHRTLDDLFAGYTGDYRPTEFDTGADVGMEAFD